MASSIVNDPAALARERSGPAHGNRRCLRAFRRGTVAQFLYHCDGHQRRSARRERLRALLNALYS